MSKFKAIYDNFKRGDTANIVKVLLFKDDGGPIHPSNSMTGKMVLNDQYAGEFTLTTEGDYVCLPASEITDKKLPSGEYGLEIWDGNGNIYPSGGFIPIYVHRNAENSVEQVSPTVDLKGLVERIDRLSHNASVGSVRIADPGEAPSVTSAMVDGQVTFSFVLPAGQKGNKGDTGDSAYEIWVKNGHTGSVQDYLQSLVGRKGDNGESAYQTWLSLGNSGTAQDFIASLKGNKGDTGAAPVLEKGTFTMLNSDAKPTFSLTKLDETHYQYNIGYPRPHDGKNANPPTIGDNENWFQDGQDTGKPSRGHKGDQGDPGLPAKISGIEVSTLPAGSQATADVVKGDENSYLIKLSIPKGDTGGQVIKPSLTISDVQALPYDQAPTVSLKLTGENSYVLSVGIPVGQPGADGKSTYQIWLDEGNSGTEQDFLKSLIPDVSGIQKTADNANSTAQEAVDTANSAKTTANEAKSNADVAINTANTASETASTASSLASGASEAASDAAAKANEAQSTAEQALAKEPDLSPYLTSKDAADTYATKASVPTVTLDVDNRILALNGVSINIPDNVDLSGYATKSELPQVSLNTSAKTISVNGQSISIPNSVDLSGFYTKEETDQKIEDHKVDLTGYLTEDSAAKTYATKSEIPSLDGYAKKSDIPAMPDLSVYAKKTDIPAAPDLSGYETKDNAANTYATKDSLSDYAKKSDVVAAKVDYDAIYAKDKQYIEDAILNGKW